MEDYFWHSDNGKKTAPAPMEYLEMIVWPRQGIPYKPTTKLSTLERRLLGLMLEIEADCMDKRV